MSVIANVIVQPRHAQLHIERQRLKELVHAVGNTRVTAVYAPAGYGKTSALMQWADHFTNLGRPVFWISVRAGISGVDDLIAAIGAAVASAGFPIPPAVSVKGLLDGLSLPAGARPLLMIDDAHFLDPEALALLARIVSGARDSLSTIIASRSQKTIPVARLRALGCLLEVGPDDLQFSLSETTEYIATNGIRPIEVSHIQKLYDETRGWPAGIVLAGQIWQRTNGANATPQMRVSGLRREFEAYFDEEVLTAEGGDVQGFLLATAVLDDLTPAACAAVTLQANGREMLEQLEQSGLFLEANDDDRSSYRYHPLFREMMLRRLTERNPALAAELQRRASLYFTTAGQSLKAIHHARECGDRAFLADQLDLLAESLIYDGKLCLIDELGSALPVQMLASRPNLALALAWRRIRGLSCQSAESLISMAQVYVDAHAKADLASPYDFGHLTRVIEHRRIMLHAARDEMTEVEQRAESLIREFGDSQPYLSCSLLAQLMSARRELYQYHDMLKLEAETRRALGRPGSGFASIALKASVAPTFMVQGKMDSAEQMLREAMALAETIEGSGSGLAALPALPLAGLLYDRGQMEEASALVSTHLATARQWGFADQLAAGHIVHARLLAHGGDVPAAQKALEETQLLAIECNLSRLRAYAVSEQVRLFIRSGEHEAAARIFRASGLEPDDEPMPTLHPTRENEAIAVAWLRLEMHQYRLVRARKVAKRWCEFVRRSGAIRSVITFELLLAEIAVLSGDNSEARRALREAITLAAPAGWTRVFLDEGDAIGSLLIQSYADGPLLDTVPDKFAAVLVAAFRGAPTAVSAQVGGLGSKLVKRELDILRMVGGGLRNREIGDRLGLTEGTVKWYMQQVYDKLGVRRRPQAVMRARQLGILS